MDSSPAVLDEVALDRRRLEQEVRALGPWFHNMLIGGVRTEPDHFLGDYPEREDAGVGREDAVEEKAGDSMAIVHG